MNAKQLREQIDRVKNIKILKESEGEKEYFIRMPVAGVITRLVKANSKEEAIDIFMEGTLNININSEEDYDLEEWDFYSSLVEGNVFYGPLSEVEIEEQ